MKSPEEHRNALLDQIKRSYRLIRKLERALDSKPLARVYKNPKCKSAKKQAAAIEGIQYERKEELGLLLKAYNKLPETRHEVHNEQNVLAFAARLCKPKRNPRFLKNQGRFDLDQ